MHIIDLANYLYHDVSVFKSFNCYNFYTIIGSIKWKNTDALHVDDNNLLVK